jgi:hypothetical protein
MIRWLKSGLLKIWRLLKNWWQKATQRKRGRNRGDPRMDVDTGRMDVDTGIKEMARHCYGYGRWGAPYWFIGLEQGMTTGEMQRRAEAWLALDPDKTGLTDCLKFHEHQHIRDLRWHGAKPKFQKTWKQLMLLLMAFHGEPIDLTKPEDVAILRKYQRDCWGRQNGETCVIELSGLPAHDLKAGKEQKLNLFKQKEIDDILQERICVIREKILEHKPKLVVMYGRYAKKHWETIAEVTQEFPPGVLPPIFAFPVQPASIKGRRNAYWVELGKDLRERKAPPTVS